MLRTVSLVSTTPSAMPLRHCAMAVSTLVAKSRVAAKPVLIIRDGGETPAALTAGDGRKVVMKSVEMVHREGFDEPQNVGLKTAQRVPRGIIEDVVSEPVGRTQPVAGDGAKLGEVLLGGGFLGLEMGAAEQVAEAVREAQLAAVQRLQRVAAKEGFVAVLEQLEQPVMRALLGRRGGRRGGARLLGARRHGEREQQRTSAQAAGKQRQGK